MDVKSLKFRYNIASMMVFEQVTNKPFAIDGTITSMMVLVWSVIEANNPGTIELSKMLEWFDEHPDDMTYLLDELNKQIAISNVFAGEEKKNGERQRVTDMFVALVAAGADPEWVAERMRVSMFTTTYDAMIKRKHDEWERCRFEAILPAMAAGAKIKWDDFKNPYKLEEKQKDATADEIKAARQRLKQLKHGR